MSVDARWRVLQIADSGFPTGGFAHSAGLEPALAAGVVDSPATFDAFVRAHLWNCGHGSLPFVAAAHRNPEDVETLDAAADAQLVNHVANRASRTQGRAFLTTAARVFDAPAVIDLAGRAAARRITAHYAPVFGASVAALEISLADALATHLLLALRGVVSAAVRLGIVGPNEGQRIQGRHAGTLDAVLAQCRALTPDDAACVAPVFDALGATHDRLYARLFQS
jgi:urease accessory protein